MGKEAKIQPAQQVDNSTVEIHPYGIFADEETERLIVGTFPAAEFTSIPTQIDPKTMINFFYGRIEGKGSNQLWKLIGDVFGYEMNSIDKIKSILQFHRIGIADVCEKVIRKIPGDASDKNLEVKEWNTALCDFLNKNKNVTELLFTSKNAFEWFQKYLKPQINQDFKETVLLSPSKAANLYIAGLEEYKDGTYKDIYEFRLEKYKNFFLGGPLNQAEAMNHFEAQLGINQNKTSLPEEIRPESEESIPSDQFIKDIILAKNGWISFKKNNNIKSDADLYPHFKEISDILYFWAIGTLKIQKDSIELVAPNLQEYSLKNWNELLPNAYLIVDDFLQHFDDDKKWSKESISHFITKDNKYLNSIIPMMMLFYICDGIRFQDDTSFGTNDSQNWTNSSGDKVVSPGEFLGMLKESQLKWNNYFLEKRIHGMSDVLKHSTMIVDILEKPAKAYFDLKKDIEPEFRDIDEFRAKCLAAREDLLAPLFTLINTFFPSYQFADEINQKDSKVVQADDLVENKVFLGIFMVYTICMNEVIDR